METVKGAICESPNGLLVYGSREFGQVIKELAADCGYEFGGFIDDTRTGPEVLGSFDAVCKTHSAESYSIAMAIGYSHLRARREVASRVRNAGYVLANLVHPRAWIAPSARLGDGVTVMAMACVDMRVRVGDLSVLWPGAVISHDSVLDGNSFVSPNATICGHCNLRKDTFLGAGSTVTDHVEVPEGTFLKANAVFAGSL